MDHSASFGEWIRRRRKAVDLTQDELASRVACSVATIRKIEADARRPSRQLAELLARVLEIPASDQALFLRVARGTQATDRLAAVAPATGTVPAPSARHVPLPQPATPLIGREAELAELKRLLARPDCRLLTIVGLGGIGKTRLALALAADQQDDFADGVAFANLAALSAPEFILPAVAEALGLTFSGPAEPHAQLLNYLRAKSLLLVLDSVEHLLAGPGSVAALAAELLQRAAEVKLLVVSRERLRLQGEWVFDLQGLPFPTEGERQPQGYSAMELFAARARQARAGFGLSAENQGAVARICRLVEGMPLGLELAAAWVPALTCTEIADEIERGLDFLAAASHDRPTRHQSLRAVFDSSWKQLPAEEQHVMGRLAVFRGGFTREAAATAAQAPLPRLAALVTKSLVQHQAAGRYDLHELVRQYAGERLAEAPEAEAQARRAHAHYYLALLRDRQAALTGDRQREALAEINAELDNVRAAWDWATAQGDFAWMCAAAWPLWYFFDIVNLYREPAAMLERAEQAVLARLKQGAADPPQLEQWLGRLRVWRAASGLRLGQAEAMRQLLQTTLPALRAAAEPEPYADGLWVLALLSWLSGDFSGAAEAAEAGLALNRQLGRPWQTAFITVVYGAVRHERGEYAEAHALLTEGLRLCQALGVARNTAFALGLLTRTAQALGHGDDIQPLMREQLRLAAEMDDRSAMAFMLENLALGLQAGGAPGEAREHFAQSSALYEDLGDAWSLARTQNYLGQLELAVGQPVEAQRHFVAGLQAALDAQADPYALDCLEGVAQVLARRGDDESALELVTHVRQHPGTAQTARERAERLCAELQGRLTPEQAAGVAARARERGWEAVAGRVLGNW
jgi:predicted ATPase/DNA-binding XRE family transcriptional regulator